MAQKEKQVCPICGDTRTVDHPKNQEEAKLDFTYENNNENTDTKIKPRNNKISFVQILILIIYIVGLIGICFLIAFKVNEEDVSRWTLFATLMFGFSGLIIGVLNLLLYFLKTNRHNKDVSYKK